MNISVQEAEKLSLEEIRRFVEASEAIQFAGEKREQVYGWIERVLCQQQYARQGGAKVAVEFEGRFEGFVKGQTPSKTSSKKWFGMLANRPYRLTNFLFTRRRTVKTQ